MARWAPSLKTLLLFDTRTCPLPDTRASPPYGRLRAFRRKSIYPNAVNFETLFGIKVGHVTPQNLGFHVTLHIPPARHAMLSLTCSDGAVGAKTNALSADKDDAL